MLLIVVISNKLHFVLYILLKINSSQKNELQEGSPLTFELWTYVIFFNLIKAQYFLKET